MEIEIGHRYRGPKTMVRTEPWEKYPIPSLLSVHSAAIGAPSSRLVQWDGIIGLKANN